jgi:hypothetical protein
MQRTIGHAPHPKINGVRRMLLMLAVTIVVLALFAVVWEMAVPAVSVGQPVHGTAYRMPRCLDPLWEPRSPACPGLPPPTM